MSMSQERILKIPLPLALQGSNQTSQKQREPLMPNEWHRLLLELCRRGTSKRQNKTANSQTKSHLPDHLRRLLTLKIEWLKQLPLNHSAKQMAPFDADVTSLAYLAKTP
jgi:hypothetical protein